MIAKVIVLVLLASIVLIAGMFLLAKSKKDNLGKMYNGVAYGTISFSLLVIVFAIVGCCCMCCMKNCKKGDKCESKKECKMDCEDKKGCSMNAGGGSCSKGESCPMMGGSCKEGGKGGECSSMGGKACCAGHSGATATHEIIIEKKIDDAPKDAKKTVEIKVDGK